MDGRVSEWVRRFWQLPLLVQCTAIVVAAVLGTVGLTLMFYSIFFSDRLLLDLLLSAAIAIIVGYPLAYVFLRQSVKLMRMAEELETISRIDDLTQLLNRKTFLGATRARIAEAAGQESAGALLFIDFDHFKALNDTWGHAAGDAALQQFGTVVRSCVGQDGIAGRLGGEEFAIFLPRGGRAGVRRLAERIRREVSAVPARLGLEDWALTVSIGVAEHRAGQALEELLRTADGSLYKAKFQGRDRTVYAQEPVLAA